MGKIFLLWGIAFAAIAGSVKTELPVKGYRILHASPQDFHYALYTPTPRGRAPRSRAEAGTSRLEKYFRVTRKIIEGSKVGLVVLPEVPLLGTALGQLREIEIEIVLKDQGPDSYRYGVKLLGKVPLQGQMLVTPHPSGALMELSFDPKENEGWVRNTLLKVPFSLGFLSERPDLTS